MSIITAKAKVTTKNEETGEETESEIPIEVEYEFGDNMNQLIETHGAEACFHHAKSAMTVALQSAMRSWATQGLVGDELQAKLDDWSVPTGRPRGMSRVERFKENLSKLSDADRAEVLKDLGLMPA